MYLAQYEPRLLNYLLPLIAKQKVGISNTCLLLLTLVLFNNYK